MKPDFENMVAGCYNPADALVIVREAYAAGMARVRECIHHDKHEWEGATAANGDPYQVCKICGDST